MIGSSENPFHPLGFGQHCGNVADNYWYGYSWRNGCNDKLIKECIKYAVDHFKADCSHIGKPISWEQLPVDVQKFAEQSFA